MYQSFVGYFLPSFLPSNMLSLLALAIALVLTMVVFLRYMRRVRRPNHPGTIVPVAPMSCSPCVFVRAPQPEGAPPAVSVLDNLRWLRDFRRQPFELVTEFSAKYGPAFSVRMIGFRLNVVADREFAEVRPAFHVQHACIALVFLARDASLAAVAAAAIPSSRALSLHNRVLRCVMVCAFA